MRLMVILTASALALFLTACGGEDVQGGEDLGGNAPELSSLAGESAPGDVVGVSAQGITVVGTGRAKSVPDVAEWSFGVRSEGESATAALQANSEAMRGVLAALGQAGIGKDDLRTEQVSLYPQMDESGRGIFGYTASNTVHATVRGIDRTGAVVDAAVQAGANELYGPNLVVSDTDDEYAQAIEEAFDDARARAEAVAAKAGLTLGQPIAIVEGGGGGVPVPLYRTALAEAAAAPIEPGTQEIQALLTVTFAIS